MRAAALRRQRGFTLVEVMAVIVLAAIVGFGLIGFYLNSQATWIDASSQAMAQRDGTLILETITDLSRPWSEAVVEPVGGGNDRLIIRDALLEKERFYWDSGDSLLHHSKDGAATGPAMVNSRVERFAASIDSTGRLVSIDSLRVVSTTGRQVRLATAFVLYNRAP